MRIIDLLRSKRGDGHITAAVWMVILLMLFLWVLDFAGMLSQAVRVQDNTRRMLDGYVTQNAAEIYRSVKNGHDLTQTLNSDALRDACQTELGLQDWKAVDGSGHIQYSISDFTVSFIQEETLQLQVTYTIHFPIEMAGQVYTTANIPQRLSSCYHLKLE